MPGKYAASTTVRMESTRMEIERELTRFGASGFGYMNENNLAAVLFSIDGLRVMIRLQLPSFDDFAPDKWDYRPRWRDAQEKKQVKDYDQSIRQRWRALLYVIKAKMVAVDEDIETVEEAFAIHTLLPDGSTVGDRIIPEIRHIVDSGMVPSLIPMKAMPSGMIIALGDGGSRQ